MKKNLFKRAMAMGLSVLMVSGLSGCNGSEGKDFTLEAGDLMTYSADFNDG